MGATAKVLGTVAYKGQLACPIPFLLYRLPLPSVCREARTAFARYRDTYDELSHRFYLVHL